MKAGKKSRLLRVLKYPILTNILQVPYQPLILVPRVSMSLRPKPKLLGLLPGSGYRILQSTLQILATLLSL